MFSRISRAALAQLLAVTFATAGALAQTPVTPEAPPSPEAPPATETPDPLCEGLVNALGAAEEDIPFIILVPANQSLGSLPRLSRNPPGFAEFRNCQLYRAGNAKQGTVGGGPHNFLRCNALSTLTSENNPEDGEAADAAASEVYTKLAARTRACLEPAGWIASGGERTRKYEDHESILTFTRKDTTNDVIVRFLQDSPSPGSRSKSTSWSVDLTVRNPNPNHPKPQ